MVKLRHCLDRILHIRNNSSVKIKGKNMNNAFSLSKQDLKTHYHNLSKVNLNLFDRQCFSRSRPIFYTQVIDFKLQPIKQKKCLRQIAFSQCFMHLVWDVNLDSMFLLIGYGKNLCWSVSSRSLGLL